MYSYYEKASIFALISIFLVINLLYKRLVNVVIFLTSYIVFSMFMKNNYTALIGAYILGIGYGIFKNFHLLENFQKEVPIESDPKFKKLNSDTIKLSKNQLDISPYQITKYLEKLNKEDEELVFTRKVFIYDLKPTKDELSNNKIKKMKTSKKAMKRPVVISGDNYIIDGHHRWFSLHSDNKSKENDANFITATIIDLPINKCIENLKEFKTEFNENTLNNFNIDKTKVSQAETSIAELKKHVNLLDTYLGDLKNINLV